MTVIQPMQSQPQVMPARLIQIPDTNILLLPTSGGGSSPNRPPSLKLSCLSAPSTRPPSPLDSWNTSTPISLSPLIGSMGMMTPSPLATPTTPNYVITSPQDVTCFTLAGNIPTIMPQEFPPTTAGITSNTVACSTGLGTLSSQMVVQGLSPVSTGCAPDEPMSETTWPDMDRKAALQKSDEALAQRFEEVSQRLTSGTCGAEAQERPKPSVMEYSSHPASSCKSIRAKWTADEDQRVLELVAKHGRNWCPIAQELGTGRSGKQIRERWKNQLRSGINKGKWTREEYKKFPSLYLRFGNKWARIAVEMGRSENSVKNYFHQSFSKSEDYRQIRMERAQKGYSSSSQQ